MTDRSDDRHPTGPPLSRRDALIVLGAAAAIPLGGSGLEPAPSDQAGPIGGPRGTPSDPVLTRPRIWWTKVLEPIELATLAVLCDTIIPRDDRSPAASDAGAPDYINEYVSAPYDECRAALVQVRGGLTWVDAESGRRFGRPFRRLATAERKAICDEICYLPDAKPEFRAPARFFALVRDLTATAFYTTREGMKDLGYVGNVPLRSFTPPPSEVLQRLGIEPTQEGR